MTKTNKNVSRPNLFDKYAVWNLVLAIVLLIMIIFWSIYGGLYDKNKTFHDQFGGTWFYLTLAFSICMTVVLYVVNGYYSVKKIIFCVRNHESQGLWFYGFGIVIPVLGMVYDLIDRKTLFFISDNLVENKGGE